MGSTSYAPRCDESPYDFGFLSKIAKIRSVWAFFVAALMQRVPFAVLAPASMVGLKKTLLISSYILLGGALLRNLHFRSVRIILLGVLLNFTVIIANGGLMPVTPEAISLAGMQELDSNWLGKVTPHGTGILLTLDQTRLWPLTDIIPWDFIGGVFSIGDLVLGVGLVLFLLEIICGRQSRSIAD